MTELSNNSAASTIESAASNSSKQRRHGSSQEAAYETLRAEILAGVLRSGTDLREVSLAERLNISRTPVREALLRLEAEGLITRRANGMSVAQFSTEQVIDAYNVRIPLESMAAACAAERRTDYDIARLRSALNASREPGDITTEGKQRLNFKFHHRLWVSSGNPILSDLLQRLHDTVVLSPSTTLDAPGRWEEAIEEHSHILDAVVNREPEKAKELAGRHMQAALDLRLAALTADYR